MDSIINLDILKVKSNKEGKNKLQQDGKEENLSTFSYDFKLNNENNEDVDKNINVDAFSLVEKAGIDKLKNKREKKIIKRKI